MHATMPISDERSLLSQQQQEATVVEAPAAPLDQDEDEDEEEDYGHFDVYDDYDDDDAEEHEGRGGKEQEGQSSIASSTSNSSSGEAVSSGGGGGSRGEDGGDANAAPPGCSSPARAPTTTTTPRNNDHTSTGNHLSTLRDLRTESSSNLLLMKRVGSTFFFSVAEDLDLLEQWSTATTTTTTGGDAADAGVGAGVGRASLSLGTASAATTRAATANAATATATATANTGTTPSCPTAKQQQIALEVTWNVADVLYHDIMMNVFSYLPAADLASYSETGSRPNFDVFSFVLLQLERALLLSPSTAAGTAAAATGTGGSSGGEESSEGSASRSSLAAATATDDESGARTAATSISSATPYPVDICGASILSRLAVIDRIQAEDLVEQYRTGLSSSSSSPAAFSADAALKELQNRMGGKAGAATSCAVVFTMLGAASKLMDGGLMQYADAVPHNAHALLGCAGLGLVATRYAATATAGTGSAVEEDGGGGDDEEDTANGEEGASARLARRMQALLMTLPRVDEEEAGDGEEGSDGSSGGAGGSSVFPLQIVERLARQFHHHHSNDNDVDNHNPGSSSGRRGKRTKRKGSSSGGSEEELVQTEMEEEEGCESPLSSEQPEEEEVTATSKRRSPSGHIGSFVRVLQLATEAVTRHVRLERRMAFERMSDDEKTLATTALIDASSSDSNLELVKGLVRNQGVDVNGFYVGSDGTTETCALHTAAFNNATDVMRFLCSGIDERHGSLDGGLCDVDLVDENGWTALHFAAGADSAEGVRTLASFGAQTAREAQNGYTPWGWADRLSNTEAAEELRRLGADQRFVFSKPTQPFAFLANRFFALMPSATPIATM